MYRPAFVRLVAPILAVLLVLAACGSDDDSAASGAPADEEPDTDRGVDDPDAPEEPDEPAEPEEPGEDEPEDDEPAEPEPSAPEIDPAEVGADELGMVPVLMYHMLRDTVVGDFDMTPADFRAELEYLFDEGYVPIRTIDLARGEIDIPAGKSPVVLTFDDSTRSQAHLDDDGEIHPDSSIGILIDVAAQYEDVEPVASMYVITSSLFGGGADDEDIVAALADLGIEIANHSHTHPILRGLSPDEVQEELATNVAQVREMVPDAEVATLSLPLGMFPDDPELAVRGEWGGTSYEHEGVLLVGYNPAPSPFHADFDPTQIPRIQTNRDAEYQFGSAWWFEQFEVGASTRRYVSDGDPTTISFPAERADELDDAFADRANPY